MKNNNKIAPHQKITNLNSLLEYLSLQLSPYRRHWDASFFKNEISVKAYFNYLTKDGYLIHFDFPFENGRCNEMIIWGRDYIGNRWDYKVPIKKIEYNKLKEKIYDLL